MENLLVPDQATLNIPCTKALVLAPHPDDEVFGCGGAIMRHVEHHVPVQVIIVTNGAYNVSKENESDYYIRQRQQESLSAASILGYGTPVFWQYNDRDLFYGEKLITDIASAINSTGVDLVYAPSIYEIHPDHRALGMATIEAARRASHSIQLAFYEIGLPLRPNLLIDISDLATRKAQAMACFTSQNAIQRYDLDIAALNRYRTYTLPTEVTAAEAYILINSTELESDPFKFYQSEHSRQQKIGLALDTKDVPLVSVIIRSLDRPTLSDALDSVALQTYANIEVIVVNALGYTHRALAQWCGRFPLRMTSNAEPLQRCKAANIGLQTAAGFYAIFLDDDDLFLPDHITNLVAALQQNRNFRGAYAGVRVDHYIRGKLESSSVFNEPFDERKLRGRNFIPIHAVLFERSLVADGCRFDEQFDAFEDWDFWFQILQHTELMHVDKISSVYRNAGHSGLGLQQNKNDIRALRGKVYNKWKNQLQGEQIDDLIEYQEEVISNLRHNLIEAHSHLSDISTQLENTHNQLETAHSQLDELNNQLRNSENQGNTLLNEKNHLIQEVQAIRAREASLQTTVNNLVQSTSWKTTAPLRFVSRIVKGRHHEAINSLRRRVTPFLRTIYWRLPATWRNTVLTTAYRFAGPLFSGMGHYETWRSNSKHAYNHRPSTATGFLANMVDLPDLSPLTTEIPGSIAIHAHIFYPDLASEFAKHLHNMPFAYDLFVSTPNEEAKTVCETAFLKLPKMGKLTITIVPNRGRDIAPIFCTFGDALSQYDYFAHIHSKKSLYNNGATDGWRQYLLTNLLGSEQTIRRIFTLLTSENRIGLVYPQNFAKLPYLAYTWCSNKANGLAWCNKLRINPFPTGYFDFPAGSMFWARSEALHPLFEAQIKIEEFPEEAGQTDGTLAHSLERLLVLVTKRSGFNTLILRDTQSNSWSRWRFEQYVSRKMEDILAMLSDPSIQIVVFDIFDTLLTRPLLHPEKIKSIVAQCANDELKEAYLRLRIVAESQARQKAGRDIGLDAIFKEFTILSGLPPESIKELKNLEESIEIKAVSPRPDVVILLNTAINQGKHVVLASDMYLPKSAIETMLAQNNITGWHQLYVSSDIGLRKDTGELYQHILSEKQVLPSAVMVIGDDEHSDIQVPYNTKIRFCHILRPVELARAIPRLSPILEESIYHDNLNIQLTLGIIVQKNFQPLSFPHFDPADIVPPSPWAIGFSIAGPLILSFIQWLTKEAAKSNIQHLYFLSREGQILKAVYDRWTSNNSGVIPSNYLVLSRRAIAVPTISSLNDIYEIARIQFFPNQLSIFLIERYGINLSEQEYDEFARLELWPRDKLVIVENKNIEHLKPLLQVLEQRIIVQAQSELPGLLAYLNQMGLNTYNSSAIVDIGYAATIQGRLNCLLDKSIHGYYMITETRAQRVSEQNNVITQGCYEHFANAFENPPPILRGSFIMEKLLSSDEAQIICYHIEDSGDIIPEYRKLTDEERQTMTIRAEIRCGIMDFVDRSIDIRTKLVSDYMIPTELAKNLYEAFVEHHSKSELEILKKLVLDDYYCGRGLVS